MSKSVVLRKKHRPSALGLTQFADAKRSTYDKQARKQKERNLNSKVVNKYRKLKARLTDGSEAGQSEPSRPSGPQQEHGQVRLVCACDARTIEPIEPGKHRAQLHDKSWMHLLYRRRW